MIAEAEAEGSHEAAESFRLAFEHEKHHQQMFRNVLIAFQERKAHIAHDTSGACTGIGPVNEKGHPRCTKVINTCR